MSEGGWFAFKAGNAGIAISEASGFMDNYSEHSSFILLIRRDLVAQAVSSIKAQLTSRFHSTQSETKTAVLSDYRRDEILSSMSSIFDNLRALDSYIRASGRPSRRLFYEDFHTGDFSSTDLSCRDFGIARRAEERANPARVVEKIGDSLNSEWCLRFRSEHDEGSRNLLDAYQRFIAA